MLFYSSSRFVIECGRSRCYCGVSGLYSATNLGWIYHSDGVWAVSGSKNTEMISEEIRWI